MSIKESIETADGRVSAVSRDGDGWSYTVWTGQKWQPAAYHHTELGAELKRNATKVLLACVGLGRRKSAVAAEKKYIRDCQVSGYVRNWRAYVA